jgi:hypothetical protein
MSTVSLGMRCASTTKIQKANTRVWIGNITISQQNKFKNATNSKKSYFFNSQEPTQTL